LDPRFRLPAVCPTGIQAGGDKLQIPLNIPSFFGIFVNSMSFWLKLVIDISFFISLLPSAAGKKKGLEMVKSLTFKIVIIMFAVYCAYGLSGCGKKNDENKTTTPGDSTKNTSKVQITKDPATGKDKVLFKYLVNKGDKFVYRMEATTSNSENSPATQGKDMKQDNSINYYYTQEVTDVDANGIITFKVKFDSILIKAVMDTLTVKYNSNVNDTVRANPNFIQYNAVINEPFYIRFSPNGEISDVYGLEAIYNNIFKALGDTLKEADKESIKQSFGKEQIKDILQQQYQVFPDQPVTVDSSWVRVFDTQVAVFDVVNNAKYTFTGLENKNDQQIAHVTAYLTVEFKSKEVKQKGVKMTVENAETSGDGKIDVNLNRGCVTYKETNTKLKIDMRLSAQGQSAKSTQGVTSNLKVTLLN